MSAKYKVGVQYQPPLHREIGPGCVIQAHGVKHVIRRLVSLDTFLSLNLATRQEVVLQMDDIVPLYPTGNTPDLATLSESAWEEAIHRYHAVQEYLESADKTTAGSRAIANKYDITLSTLYRWVTRFRQGWTVSSLIRPIRKDSGVHKLSELQDKLIEHVIIKHYLKRERTSIRSCHRKLGSLCRKLKVECPHFNTFRSRVNNFAPEVRTYHRHGQQAALPYQPVKGQFPEGRTPYDVVQIDHTLVDIILVDDIHRIAIGRPWITLAIDTFSRMVLGWYISFNTPGTLGTGICISTAVLPKKQILHRLDVNYSWPCFGRPRVLHADNAKEFHGHTLEIACQEHQITLQFRKLRKPRYGAHIERLMGTLAQEIHGLEGTTFSNPAEKGDYKATENASMTLAEFEAWLAHLILGQYHHKKHDGIGMPPIAKYREGIMGTDTQPGTGYVQVLPDPEKFRIDFLPLVERTIQPTGVQLDYIYYYSDVLRPWIGARENGMGRKSRLFIFRRDPRDISYLYFFDPELNQYFRIPYRDPTHPAITLWELKAVQRYLADQGKSAEDENVIFDAIDEMGRIQETAKNLTQQKKKEQKKLNKRGIDPVSAVAPTSQNPSPETQAQSARHEYVPARAPLRKPSEIKPFEDVDDL